ncbi:MAG: HNH endonuclease, partial [Actinomycetota bacterium]|nr:HNH endonuclease [Actinomycetota bacterium]
MCSALDHITAWEDGGTTNPANLHPLCPRHHHAKHQAGWHVQRDDDTSATERTSPTGRRYQKPPDPYPIDTTLDPPPAPTTKLPRSERTTLPSRSPSTSRSRGPEAKLCVANRDGRNWQQDEWPRRIHHAFTHAPGHAPHRAAPAHRAPDLSRPRPHHSP